jgi:hypothetical protein
MALNLVNFVGNLFQTTRTTAVTPVAPRQSNNPFASPFIGIQNNNNDLYGQNKPITGGYFAGYYNGKPNIVGSRLFVEV